MHNTHAHAARRGNLVLEHHAVAYFSDSASQASVIPQALVTMANGRSSDFILGGAAFPLLQAKAVACFFALPLNKDSQHRVMSQNLTAFPS